jgi:hypothetical protein
MGDASSGVIDWVVVMPPPFAAAVPLAKKALSAQKNRLEPRIYLLHIYLYRIDTRR